MTHQTHGHCHTRSLFFREKKEKRKRVVFECASAYVLISISQRTHSKNARNNREISYYLIRLTAVFSTVDDVFPQFFVNSFFNQAIRERTQLHFSLSSLLPQFFLFFLTRIQILQTTVFDYIILYQILIAFSDLLIICSWFFLSNSFGARWVILDLIELSRSFSTDPIMNPFSSGTRLRLVTTTTVFHFSATIHCLDHQMGSRVGLEFCSKFGF